MRHDICENCGTLIGKLETPRIWKDNVVCFHCYQKLEDSDNQRTIPIARKESLERDADTPRLLSEPGKKKTTHPLRLAGLILVLCGLIFSFTLNPMVGNLFIGIGIILWIVGFAYSRPK